MKLSKKQKEVIIKMREGHAIVSRDGSNADYITDGTTYKIVRYMTIRNLMQMGLLSNNFKLTELGKTIELTIKETVQK